MKIGAFKSISTSSEELDRVQTNISNAIRPLLSSPIVNGFILSGVALTNGTRNVIDHKLNRALVGWFIIGSNAGATVWDEQNTNTTPERTLFLQCSANVTVNLWVF